MNIYETANYILQNSGPMTALKLHKLLYYSQAWNLVWEETPLFEEDFEAWNVGPINKDMYQKHIGMLNLGKDFFSSFNTKPTNPEKDNINKVLEFYGEKKNQWLTHLVKQEIPYKNTREQNNSDPKSGEIIPNELIFEYYSSLSNEKEDEVTEEKAEPDAEPDADETYDPENPPARYEDEKQNAQFKKDLDYIQNYTC